jgi:ribosomal protein L37AE/L43A
MPRVSPDRIRKDLFCPECGHAGMFKKLGDTATSGKPRWVCNKCKHRTTKPLYSEPQILPKFRVGEIRKHKRFIITSAVNDTPLVKEAHQTLTNMAAKLKACYLVIPTYYKNPNMVKQGIQHRYTWPQEILPFLCNGDVSLNQSICIRGDTKIEHTVLNPLSGKNHAGGIQSEIFGHPQVAMELVATPKWAFPKMMHTTGTISTENYGNSSKGKNARFHHSVSAVLIEIEGDSFWITQLHYDGDGIALFNKYYTPNRVQKLGPVSAISFGDTHVRFLEDRTRKLLDQVRRSLLPKYEVYHDLHDHHIGSHHNSKDTVFLLKKSIEKEWCIRAELMKSVDFLFDKPNAVVVDSNHNNHLNQWFNRFKPHNDPVNINLYTELAGMLREDLIAGGDGNLFRLFIEKYCSNTVKFVGYNDEFILHDIDLTQHGDKGPNGSRGSAKSFSKTGYKTVIGHGHSPMIEKGCYQNGTSALGMYYAQGYSSWLNTHTIIYPNGKRGQFSIIKDKLSPLMRQL